MIHSLAPRKIRLKSGIFVFKKEKKKSNFPHSMGGDCGDACCFQDIRTMDENVGTNKNTWSLNL